MFFSSFLLATTCVPPPPFYFSPPLGTDPPPPLITRTLRHWPLDGFYPPLGIPTLSCSFFSSLPSRPACVLHRLCRSLFSGVFKIDVAPGPRTSLSFLLYSHLPLGPPVRPRPHRQAFYSRNEFLALISPNTHPRSVRLFPFLVILDPLCIATFGPLF